MRTRLAALVLLVGVGATACVTSEVTTNDPTDAAGVTPVASPDVDPTAPTTAVDAEAAIAWDALADRFLLLAEEATDEATRIGDQVALLSDGDMARDGWFEDCCAEPRTGLLTCLEEMAAELEVAADLAARLSTSRWRITDGRSALRTTMWQLEEGIEDAGRSDPDLARSVVRDLPRVVAHLIGDSVATGGASG